MTPATLPRREFLSACLLAPLLASARTPARQIRIAVKFNMVREELSTTDKFKLLQDLGFDGVEIYSRDHAELDQYVAAIKASGLPVHGVVNSSDPNIVRAVEMASRLDADSVLVLAQEDRKQSYVENVALWQERIRQALPLAEARQVRLCIENVRATFLKEAEQMVAFVDSFQSPYVRAYYDTGNTITWTEQSAEHWAKTLAGRIYKVDVKDRGHAVFGDAKLASKTAKGTDGGEVNWGAVRRELAKIGYRGWATAEVAGGDREHLKKMAQWMDQVLGNSQ